MEFLALLLKHWDLIDLVINAIEGKQLTKDEMTKAVKDAMTAASDAAMAAKFGGS